MSKIKIAIVGVGNCVSSLIQGIHYYRGKNREDAIGLMHYDMNGYKPGDIEVVAAFAHAFPPDLVRDSLKILADAASVLRGHGQVAGASGAAGGGVVDQGVFVGVESAARAADAARLSP